MKMINLSKLKALAFSMTLLAIFSCSKEEVSKESQLKVSNATAVTTNDMIGSWNLSAMMADVAVNLDQDQTSSTNLLDETDCFNTMYIIFNNDNTFDTNNATMTFEAGDGNDFSCRQDRMDNGKWEIKENKLILTMTINGETYTHEKAIDLNSDKFSFNVTKIESDQYVNDPGNTQASSIRILELEYTRA